MDNDRLAQLEKTLRELPIIKKELAKLRNQLPSTLSYHSIQHTEDVLREALLFGIHDNLKDRDLELLAIAATFHDSGFLVKHFANEVYGADFAAVAMELSGSYEPEEAALVSRMILDTEIKQGPNGPDFLASTYLSGYLLDADVSNFGREDFFAKAQLIANETNQTIASMKPSLILLLQKHKWHTAAARMLREEQKARNLTLLMQM